MLLLILELFGIWIKYRYIYIMHTMFLDGVIADIFNMGYSIPIARVLYLCAVFIFSTVVDFLGDFLTKKIDGLCSWLY